MFCFFVFWYYSGLFVLLVLKVSGLLFSFFCFFFFFFFFFCCCCLLSFQSFQFFVFGFLFCFCVFLFFILFENKKKKKIVRKKRVFSESDFSCLRNSLARNDNGLHSIRSAQL